MSLASRPVSIHASSLARSAVDRMQTSNSVLNELAVEARLGRILALPDMTADSVLVKQTPGQVHCWRSQ
jgi:hypothetical protein